MTQVRNPLDYWCAPNAATPDYVICRRFKDWLAYGLCVCWLGSDSKDPDSHVNLSEPFTHENVSELRSLFLDMVETTIESLWSGVYCPGDGEIDQEQRTLNIGKRNVDGDFVGDADMTSLGWSVRLDRDAMMFELYTTGGDPVAIWLAYAAVLNRKQVFKHLRVARKTLLPDVGYEPNEVYGLLAAATCSSIFAELDQMASEENDVTETSLLAKRVLAGLLREVECPPTNLRAESEDVVLEWYLARIRIEVTLSDNLSWRWCLPGGGDWTCEEMSDDERKQSDNFHHLPERLRSKFRELLEMK